MDYLAKWGVIEQCLKYEMGEKIAFTGTPFWDKYVRNKQNWLIFLVYVCMCMSVCVWEREINWSIPRDIHNCLLRRLSKIKSRTKFYLVGYASLAPELNCWERGESWALRLMAKYYVLLIDNLYTESESTWVGRTWYWFPLRREEGRIIELVLCVSVQLCFSEIHVKQEGCKFNICDNYMDVCLYFQLYSDV